MEVDGKAQISGTTANAFIEDVVYTVKAEDGTTAKYTVSFTLNEQPTFGISDDKTAIEMNGYLNSESGKEFRALLAQHAGVKKIDIKECEGSLNDDTTLVLSRFVHEQGIETHLMDNGLVHSGGTDFFLAGVKRTRGTNAKICVHSWQETDDDGKEIEGKDLPEDDSRHKPYIDYYKSVGFSEADAKTFYFFTLKAADFEGQHCMTDAELKTYKVLTE